MRILCIEDDEGHARLLQRRLERAGYTVYIARDGREGIELLKSICFDFLIIDYDIPYQDGLKIVGILRDRRLLPPTIMITGAGSESVAVSAMKLGVGDYLVKDIDGTYLESIPSVIEQVMTQHRIALEKTKLTEEHERLVATLKESIERIKKITGLLPICSNCKRIRDEAGVWEQLETFMREKGGLEFSHTICPQCARDLYPDIFKDDENDTMK